MSPPFKCINIMANFKRFQLYKSDAGRLYFVDQFDSLAEARSYVACKRCVGLLRNPMIVIRSSDSIVVKRYNPVMPFDYSNPVND